MQLLNFYQFSKKFSRLYFYVIVIDTKNYNILYYFENSIKFQLQSRLAIRSLFIVFLFLSIKVEKGSFFGIIFLLFQWNILTRGAQSLKFLNYLASHDHCAKFFNFYTIVWLLFKKIELFPILSLCFFFQNLTKVLHFSTKLEFNFKSFRKTELLFHFSMVFFLNFPKIFHFFLLIQVKILFWHVFRSNFQIIFSIFQFKKMSFFHSFILFFQKFTKVFHFPCKLEVKFQSFQFFSAKRQKTSSFFF